MTRTTSMSMRMVALMVALCMVVAVVPVGAAAPEVGAPSALPQGEPLSDLQLEQVEGDGVITVLGAAAVGAVTGVASYAAGYAYDRYVAKEEVSWSWKEAGRSASTSATSAAMGAVIATWWAP